MKPCIRCGRWFDINDRAEQQKILNTQQQQQQTALQPPPPAVPLRFFNNFPAIVSAWNRMHGGNTSTMNNHAPPQTPNHNQMFRSSEQEIKVEQQEDDSKQQKSKRSTNLRKNDEAHQKMVEMFTNTSATSTQYTSSTHHHNNNNKNRNEHFDSQMFYCGLPDCADPVTKSQTDVKHACQPLKWEFVVPCSDCGRVWPVPIPHPSSYVDVEAMVSSEDGDNSFFVRTQKRFLCSHYPTSWKIAVATLGKEYLQAQKDAGNSVETIKADPCPSMLFLPLAASSAMMMMNNQQMLQRSATTVKKQQQESAQKSKRHNDNDDDEDHSPPMKETQELLLPQDDVLDLKIMVDKNDNNKKRKGGNSTTTQLPKPKTTAQKNQLINPKADPPIIAELKPKSFVFASHHTTTLKFFAGCLPVSEKLKETIKRNRQVQARTKLRLEAAAIQHPIPETPVQEEATTVVKQEETNSVSQSASKSSVAGSSSSVSLSKIQKQKEKEERERMQQLSFAMRCTSIVSARSGFVGVNDPTLDEWCNPEENREKGGQSNEKTTAENGEGGGNEKSNERNATGTGKRRGRKPATAAQQTKAEEGPVEPENSAKAVANKANTKNQNKSATTTEAAQNNTVPVEVEEDKETVEWCRCSKCNKWRVLHVDKLSEYIVPTLNNDNDLPAVKKEEEGAQHDKDPLDDWTCRMLLDGTTCATKNEANYSMAGLLTLKRRRAQFYQEYVKKRTAMHNEVNK